MDTSQVTNMSRMFLNCRSLKELNLSSFNTKRVEDMSFMFGGCSDLRMLNLKNFDTSKVTNMNGMFSGCETLEKLDLSTFDTTNVQDMSDMFKASDALKSLTFGDNFVVPDKKVDDLKLVDKDWVDTGSGTEDNPKPKHKEGLSSSRLLAQADKGNWVAKPDKEYDGPFTVKIPNNIDETITATVPEKVRPEYVGSTFEIPVPVQEGYTANKKTVAVTAGEGRLLTDDLVIYTKKSAPISKPVSDDAAKFTEFVKPQPKVQESKITSSPDSTSSAVATMVKPEKSNVEIKEPKKVSKIRGTVSKFMHYVTVHPDLGAAKVYDGQGELVPERALGDNYSWFSDKQLQFGNLKYYHISDDDWIKSDDVYLYQDVKNLVKTGDLQITPLVNSRTETISNRGLGSFSTWKTNKIAILNDHKYYQVSANEFVDSDKVEVVEK